MHKTRKENQWYFEMKAHIGADVELVLVPTVTTTSANMADDGRKAPVRDGRYGQGMAARTPSAPDRRSILRSSTLTASYVLANPDHITQLIQNWRAGDVTALDRMLPHIYIDLRAMAARLLAGEAASTLQPTELVHDTLLKFLGVDTFRINDREHFFRLFAKLMRNLVVDRVRLNKAQKRGGEWERVDMLEAIDLPLSLDMDAELLHAAIDDLEEVEPRLARIVELRYFVGLTMEDIAKALNVDERTVYRGWAVARSWLREQVEP